MTRATTFHTKRFYVVCKDEKMPMVPMTLCDAKEQAQLCDLNFPECGPHEITEGEPARAKYE